MNTFQAVRNGGSQAGLIPIRTVFGGLCYLAQIVGSVLLLLGHATGLYLAATAMTVFFASLISGAWLLLVGICNDNKGD